MADQCTIERIWQDNDFFELSVSVKNDWVAAETSFYACDSDVDQLSETIIQLLNHRSNETEWFCGTPNSDSTACVSMKFVREDRLGHIRIELYLEKETISIPKKQYCRMNVHTEEGLLERFLMSLPILKEQQLFLKISLNQQ